MSVYQSYNTVTKQLFCTNSLDKLVKEKIPYSTRHYWRKCFKQNEKHFADSNDLQQNIASNSSALKLLSGIVQKQGAKTFWKQNKLALQDVLNDKQTIQHADGILQALQISKQAYVHWFPDTICKQNIFGVCLKKYPN
jgi:hypothetical protein